MKKKYFTLSSTVAGKLKIGRNTTITLRDEKYQGSLKPNIKSSQVLWCIFAFPDVGGWGRENKVCEQPMLCRKTLRYVELVCILTSNDYKYNCLILLRKQLRYASSITLAFKIQVNEII